MSGIPHSGTEDIDLVRQDIGYTQEMKELTINIQSLLSDEKNIILYFYSNFKGILSWLSNNFGNIAVQPQIIQQASALKRESERLIALLKNVRAMTEDEIKIGAKKLMIKVTIEHDLKEEDRLEKILKFPKDIMELAKNISGLVSLAEKQAKDDSKTEIETIQLIDSFINTASIISRSCDLLIRHMDSAEKREAILGVLSELVERITSEMKELFSIDSLEKIHLQLLLNLYANEQDMLAREQSLQERQKGYNIARDSDVEKLI